MVASYNGSLHNAIFGRRHCRFKELFSRQRVPGAAADKGKLFDDDGGREDEDCFVRLAPI